MDRHADKFTAVLDGFVLDVVRSKLVMKTPQSLQMQALLKEEAATSLGIWNSLSQQR
jgi:hypothetical protein